MKRVCAGLLLTVFMAATISGCASHPAEMPILQTEQMVSFTSSSGIYLDAEGNVWTWGNNENGKMGVGAETQRSEKAMPVMTGAVKIAAGGEFCLALDGQGTVWQWGSNEQGAFGDKKENIYYKPEKMLENAVDIYAYTNYSFAIKNDGSLWAWGRGAYGTTKKLSDSGSASFAPYKIMNNVVKIKMDAMSKNFGALKADGSLWLWGNYDYGQLGNGKTGDGIYELNDPDIQYTPVKAPVTGLLDFAMGEGFVLALKKDGSLWAWGSNELGQIGNGKNGDGNLETIDALETKPYHVMDNIAAIDAFNCNSCAIDKDNNLYIWGDNTYGNCGDGTTGNIASSIKNHIRNTPYKAAENVKMVYASQITFIVKEDNSLWGCGLNAGSMLGAGIRIKLPRDNSEKDKLAIPNFTFITEDIYSLYSEFFNVAAIKNDGSVWLWGYSPLFTGVGSFTGGDAADAEAKREIRQEKDMLDTPVQLVLQK